jgi:hypothetical protein
MITEETLNSIEFRKGLLKAIEMGRDENDNYWDGENEIPISTFFEEVALSYVLDYIKTYIN